MPDDKTPAQLEAEKRYPLPNLEHHDNVEMCLQLTRREAFVEGWNAAFDYLGE